MDTGILSKPKRTYELELPHGEYAAVWSGYEIRLTDTDWDIRIRTENGVRGIVHGKITSDEGVLSFLPNDQAHP